MKEYWEERTKNYSIENLVGDVGKLPLWNRCFTALKMRELDKFDFNGKTVLDAGCGGGRFIKYLKDRGADVRGIDFSEEMLKLARANFPDAELKNASLDKIPYDDNMFDFVIVLSVFVHIMDDNVFNGAMKELKRVVKDGGKIIILDHFIGRGKNDEVGKDKITGVAYTKIRSIDRYNHLGEAVSDTPIAFFLRKLTVPFEYLYKLSVKIAYSLDKHIRFWNRVRVRVYAIKK